jgi:hypothetical protein
MRTIVAALVGLAALAPAAAAQPALTPPGAVAAPAPAPAPAAEIAAPAVLRQDAWVSLPSLDGLTGVAAGYERFLPGRRLSLAATAGLRHTAAGDYSGFAGAVGLEARWYWRGRALWTHQPRGSMIGWYVGGRATLGLSHTTNLADDRSLGTTAVVAAAGVVGYRFAPWRGLTITPSASLGLRNEHDLRGRLPPWTQGSLGVGLALGWLF